METCKPEENLTPRSAIKLASLTDKVSPSGRVDKVMGLVYLLVKLACKNSRISALEGV